MSGTPPITAKPLSKPAQNPPSNPDDRAGSVPRAGTEQARPGQSTAGNGGSTPVAGGSAASAASSGAGARPGTNSATSLGGVGNNLRPSYGAFGSRDTQTNNTTKPFGYTSTSGLLTRTSEPPSAGGASTTSSTTGTAQPAAGGPHHHHHHHHHHAHTGSTGQAASITPAAPVAGQAAPTPVRPPAPFIDLYKPFHRSLISEQEVRERERQRLAERERMQREQLAKRERERKELEAKAAGPATSPRTATASTANPYPRPSLPPSPTTARTLPAATSASPANSTKPSPLPSSSSATGSTQRPNLPLPALSTIGGRSLPSPFDQQNRAAAASQPQSATHRRTPSGGTGPRPDTAGLGLGQTSPGKPAATQPAPPSRSMFGGSAGFGGSREVKPSPGLASASLPIAREPARPASAASTASSAAKPAATAATTSTTTARPPGRDFYGNYGSYGGGFLPFSSGFDYNSFGGWGGNRRPLTEREQKDQREYAEERKRIAEEQEARKVRERELAAKQHEEARVARIQAHAERQRIMQEQDAAREKEAKAELARIRSERDRYHRNLAATNAAGTSTSDALAQVAPRREPRPYEYKTESRDYQYTPREKRPRMDAAVDEARRGNATKSRRRKDEERAKSPLRNRDLSHLTEATRKWPEVTSAAVEAWLKTVGDLNRIVATETYSGAKYRMSQHRKRNTLGGIVQVRIGGRFLGTNWKLRGAPGWDEASSTPRRNEDGAGQGEGQVCAGWDQRGVWGTDVYTDDSDLGLVLVHAGWIKWGGPQSGESDVDCVVVDVRIVPPLLKYTATERNGFRTRGWGNGHDGSSIVIEAVSRVQADQGLLAGKKNRKRRLAEYAIERQAVFSVPQQSRPNEYDGLDEEDRVSIAQGIKQVNGVMAAYEPFLISGRDGLVYKYTPDALVDYLVRDDQAAEEETEDAKSQEKLKTESLWTSDLELQYAGNRYRLSVLPSDVDCPLVRLVHTPLRAISTPKDQNNRTTVFDEIPASNLFWIPDGLVYKDTNDDEEGDEDEEAEPKVEARLCRVSGFRWIPRENDWKPEEVVKVEQVDQDQDQDQEMDTDTDGVLDEFKQRYA